MGKYLTKTDILGASDKPTREVECPEWGGTVLLRALTGDERDKYEQSLFRLSRKGKRIDADPDLTGARARLVAMCAIDEDGARLFSDAEAKALGEKSAVALDRCYQACMQLSGLTEADVEELTKN